MVKENIWETIEQQEDKYLNMLFTLLQQPSILVPYANADEDNHAPNENMDIQLFLKGIETMYHVVKDLGEAY